MRFLERCHRVPILLIGILALAPHLSNAATIDTATVALAEDASKPLRQRQFAKLVALRFDAMETAFGPLSSSMGSRVEITFRKDSDFPADRIAYAAQYEKDRNSLVFAKRVLSETLPTGGFWSRYWPYYENEVLHEEFPIIEIIDFALWDAFLQEAASSTGHAWPAQECTSPDISKRLPCAMVLRAAYEFVRQVRTPMFNENRLDRILPEDFDSFCRRALRASSPDYQEVERYGGLLLLKPLIVEFGVPRTLAYAAKTPFNIEENNLRVSVLRYQERARAALAW